MNNDKCAHCGAKAGEPACDWIECNGHSPQIAEKVELPSIDTPEFQALVEGWRKYPYGTREFLIAWAAIIAHVDHAIAASRRAELTYTVDGVVMSPLEYIDYLHDKIDTPAPASAGQAAPALPEQDARAAFKSAFLSWNGLHTDAELEKEWARGTLAGEMFRAGLAAQPAEVSAGQTGQVAIPRIPTEAMLDAARDWSVNKYSQGIGNDAAIGCWQAMYDATERAAAQGEKAPATSAGNQGHTPGPWAVGDKAMDEYPIFRKHDGKMHCVAVAFTEADARLIASAPSLSTDRAAAPADARDAARYRVLRMHVAPRDVSISMQVPPEDIPPDQAVEERIDMLCDQVVDRATHQPSAQKDNK